MTEYNKAQEALIDQYVNKSDYCLITNNNLKQFLEKFTSIDPTPDPELYVIRKYTPSNTPPFSIDIPMELETATKSLRALIDLYSYLDSYLVKSYTAGVELELEDGTKWEIIPEWKVNLE